MIKKITVLFFSISIAFISAAQEKDLNKVLKGVEPLTLRWIKAKTESWSPLAPNQIIAQKTIKAIVPHAGYEPQVSKFAIVWINHQKYTGQFQLIDMKKNSQPPNEPVVYTGTLKEHGNHIWGGNNLIADFSDFKTPGFYKIRLKLDQTKETTDSYPFEIRENLYLDLAKKGADWFKYQHCGEEVPGWYKACHLNDALVHDKDNSGKAKNITGGWHDAGDYNKWPIYTPSPLYALSMFYDVNKTKNTAYVNSIVEELAYEVSYLCKSQKEDGTFYSIISSLEKPWIYAGIPELEVQRVAVNHDVGNGNPRDAAHCIRIAAGVLRAATIIKSKYPRLADSCLALANKPYERALTFVFEDNISEQNYLGIQAGLLGADLSYFQLTGDKKYLKDAELRVKNILAAQSKEGFFLADYRKTNMAAWPDLHLTALYEFHETVKESALVKPIEQSFKKYSDYYKGFYKKSPFGNTGDFARKGEYSLITNNKTAGMNAWAFAVTYKLFKDKVYLDMAVNNLNWILGFNPADVSMMAGVGVGPGAYHHRYTAIPGHEDGVVPGGVLNGIKAGDGGILFLGDEGAQNFVLGDNLPKDYPTIDTDVKGWTYAWWPNEYHIPNNAYFIMAAYMLAEVGK